jgi:hypothetical protein
VHEIVEHAEDVSRVVRVVLMVQLHVSELSGRKGRTKSSMATSILLWLRYAGLFLTTLTAHMSCVRMF